MAWVVEHNLDIAAPPEVVWEVIADLSLYAEWNPFCLECRSSLHPGDPIDMKVKLLSRPQNQREWMVEYEEGRRFAYAMKPAPWGALRSYRAHEVLPGAPDRTRYHSYFHLRGWARPIVSGVLGSKLQSGFEGMSKAIGRRAEALWIARQKQPV